MDLLEIRLDRPLEGDDRARIEKLLSQADPSSELVVAMGRYLDALPERPDVDAWWETIPRWFAARYHRISLDPRFSRLAERRRHRVHGRRRGFEPARPRHRARAGAPLSIAELGQIVSTLVGAALDRGRRGGAPRIPSRGLPMVPARHPRLAAGHPGVHLLHLAVRRSRGAGHRLAAYVTLRYAIGHEIERQSA